MTGQSVDSGHKWVCPTLVKRSLRTVVSGNVLGCNFRPGRTQCNRRQQALRAVNRSPPQPRVTDPRARGDTDLGNAAVDWGWWGFYFSQGLITKATKAGTSVEAS